ncbi:FAD synthetase [Scopulibacillus cellulosilyticus]|uniref:FAD synthase n=1 Tax=Scopulibacillus cellulosilyticus TaxID=2665665 RepID=A0ABW2PUU8_9BACL
MKVHAAGSLQLPSSVLTIGALDGVHRGHQILISRAQQRAKEFGVPMVVYTFDPPPKVYFQHSILLTPLEEKIRRLKILGVDDLIIAPFDTKYASKGATAFLDEISELNPLEIWEGSDFRFGRNRDGDTSTLCKRFNVHSLEPIRCNSGKIISSSRIRSYLAAGMIDQAEQLLGWSLKSSEPIEV